MQRIQKRHPCLSLKYIRILRAFLWFTGGWPGEVFQDHVPLIFRVHGKLLPLLALLVSVGAVYFGIQSQDELTFFIVGDIILTSFVSIMTSIRTLIPLFKEYGALTKFFLEEFHLMNVKNKTEYAHNIYLLMEKVSYYMAVCEGTLMVFSPFIVNASVFYINLRTGVFSGRRDLNTTAIYAVAFEYPGYKHQDHFYMTTTLCLYFAYNSATCLCCMDLIILLTVFQIIGHLMILNNSIENIIKPKNMTRIKMGSVDGNGNSVVTVAMFDDEENEIVHNHLVEIIHHHRRIISFSDRVSAFYGPMLAFNYLFTLLSGCLLLVEMTNPAPGALFHYGAMAAALFGELILLSPIFEVVHSMSEKLIDAVYSTPWQCMNTRNRKTVYFLLARVQRPIQVTAMSIVPVGVTTMLGIMKTTFSYYAMLKTLE